MLRWIICLLPVLLVCGCAADPWRNAPKFEVLNFDCPVPGGKFLDHANYLSAWSLLGPIDPGPAPALHTEYVADEALLTGNCTAPRGVRWCRLRTRNDDETAPPGELDFSARFKASPKGQGRRVFYACATLKCDRDHPSMILHVSSGGQLKIWLNGKAIYSREQGAGKPQSGVAKVEDLQLVKGYNRIVVKFLDDGEDPNRRKFSLRFTDAAGNLSVAR